MRLAFSLSITTACLLGLSASHACAQDAAAPVTKPAEPTAADKAFEPIHQMLDHLVTSLRNNGGIRKNDAEALRYARDKAAAFSREYPNDSRGLAVQLQISMWLNDEPMIESLFSQLAAADPDNTAIPLSQAQYALNHNHFAQAILRPSFRRPYPEAGNTDDQRLRSSA